MSFYDFSKLSPQELVAQYVLESQQGAGALPYNDYKIIDSWLEKARGDVSLVLLILSDNLPQLLETKTNNQLVSLRLLDKKVTKKIQEAHQKI